MWIHLQLILLGSALATEISMECKEMYKANDPRPCCEIPSMFLQEVFIKQCGPICERTPDDVCCPMDCLFEKSGYIEDEEVNQEKAKELSQDLAQSFGMSLIRWYSVFKQSNQECEDIFTELGDIVSSTCQAGLIMPFFDCFHQKLFLNCPFFNESESCDAVKTFVKSQNKCGTYIVGKGFLIDGLFWRYLDPL